MRLFGLLIILTSLNGLSQRITDWQELGLSGKVKVMKDITDDLTQETYFNEQGYIDSISYVAPTHTFYDAYKRDENGWITERRYYEGDSVIAIFTYEYNVDRSTAIQTEKIQGTTANLKFNDKGQEVYRLVDMSVGNEINTIEIILTYNKNGQKIGRKSITTGPEYSSTTTYEYRFNAYGWMSGWTQTIVTDLNTTTFNYRFFNFDKDETGNFTFCERIMDGDNSAISLVRQIEYYE